MQLSLNTQRDGVDMKYYQESAQTNGRTLLPSSCCETPNHHIIPAVKTPLITMFAEEVGGNKQRKRQEEAKARRRQLKLEQQRKAQREKQAQQRNEQQQKQQQNGSEATSPSLPSATPTIATNTTATPSSSTPPAAVSNMSVIGVSRHETLNVEKSAVQIANEQRQARQQTQKMTAASRTIQSFYRAHRSNTIILLDQARLLQQRLQDLTTLRTLLASKGAATNYVPPPATCTALCRQLVLLCKSIPYKDKQQDPPSTDDGLTNGTTISSDMVSASTTFVKFRDVPRDVKLIQDVINLILLPALQQQNKDENVNPWTVWMQSPEGRYRIQVLIRIALVAATRPDVDPAVTTVCFDFLKAILGIRSVSNENVEAEGKEGTKDSTLEAFCRALIISSTIPDYGLSSVPSPEKKQKVTEMPRYVYLNSSMDIISLCRFHLLYDTGGDGSPIPASSEQTREACISTKDRDRADVLFQTVIDVLIDGTNPGSGHRKVLHQRFVSEILTVPLLTWKVSNGSIQKLLSPLSDGSSKKLLLIGILDVFTSVYGPVLDGGDLDSTLCRDIVMNNNHNATPSQCLLANLLQLGRSSVRLNGSSRLEFEYEAASCFYKFVATVVDSVPVTTFSSRASVVEWVTDGKGHHSPVVLSPIILEQCRQVISDSTWIRRLFQVSMTDYGGHFTNSTQEASNVLLHKTDIILAKKTEKDLKLEREIREAGSSSAASMAAKEARADRNKRFWNSSAWALKVTKRVSNILKKENESSKKPSSTMDELGGELINATEVSRKLAMGSRGSIGSLTAKSSDSSSILMRATPFTLKFFKSLCHLYGIIMARWGGGGGADIVRGTTKQNERNNKTKKKEMATTIAEPCTGNLLNILCFSTQFIRISWGVIQSENLTPVPPGDASVKSTCIRPLHGMHSQGINGTDGPSMFFLFILSLAHSLIITDDTEFQPRCSIGLLGADAYHFQDCSSSRDRLLEFYLW